MLTVLITNNTLAERAGTELYVRHVALERLKRGHFPIAYSTAFGNVARELEKANIPVVDNLRNLAVVPDLIHGQQHWSCWTGLCGRSLPPSPRRPHNHHGNDDKLEALLFHLEASGR